MSTLLAILLVWCALSVVVGFILGPILRAGREYREAFDAETVRLADEDEAMAVARSGRPPIKETAAFIADAYIEIERMTEGVA
jgi:hypothetical protein